MKFNSTIAPEKKKSVHALEATNFFLADVQTGLGPFLAAYLAGAGWEPGRVGMALTIGGIITVALQAPVGAIVDQLKSKKLILVLASAVLALGAVLLSITAAPWAVYASQVLIGGAGPFLGPTLAAVTMGIVGVTFFDRQFGKNQSFNSAGNVACALLIAGVSHLFGNRAIFITAAVLTIPTVFAVRAIKSSDIDYDLARGGGKQVEGKGVPARASVMKTLLKDRILLVFLACAFLFHFANAAMLPQLGEMLSHGAQATAAPFMSACVIVTQVVIMCFAPAIGRFATLHGRKPLLMLGFGVLPVRAVLYTLTHNTESLIAIQLLDGVANAIFGVVSILVVADRTRATGRFNLVQGSLATAVGLGAALSTTFGGKLIQHFSYRISFLSLGAIAALAFLLLWTAVPETLPERNEPDNDTSSPAIPPGDSSMKQIESRSPFQPQSPDEAGVISWVHLGDLHMTKAGEQNQLDLAEIVNEINQAFADSLSFVFLPGNLADDGSRSAYAVVRGELNRLNVPWCAIIGDHDVHEKSFANFLEAMSERTHYAFTVGSVRFVAMNAFDIPDPGSFAVSGDQLAWVKRELQTATDAEQSSVLLLHCYPSDLKVGADELMEAVRNFEARLIDMGHTHYNEIAKYGRTLYSATRSTGQIEEGPVGYSVINIDGDAVSWRFVELGKLPVVVITSPSDERLLTKSSETPQGNLKVRAKFWGEAEAVQATANLDGYAVPINRIDISHVWEADVSLPHEGVFSLEVSIEDARGKVSTDEIRVVSGDLEKRERVERDQDNALEAWPEHGLLGTQLGPNKNGKKW